MPEPPAAASIEELSQHAQRQLAEPESQAVAGLEELNEDEQLGEPSSVERPGELSREAPLLATTGGEVSGAAAAAIPHDPSATSVAVVLVDQQEQENGDSVADRLLRDMAEMTQQRAIARAASVAAGPAAPATDAASSHSAAKQTRKRGAAHQAARPAAAADAPAAATRKPRVAAPKHAAGPAAAAAAPAAATRKPRVAGPKPAAAKAQAKKRASASICHEATRKCFRVRLANGTSSGFSYSSEGDKEAAREQANAFAAQQTAL